MGWDRLHPYSYMMDKIKFNFSDMDVASNPMYFGFIEKDGAWKILEFNTTNGTMRYAMGTTSYTTNWTNRAALTYKYYYEVL
jgi:hypothetical protein